MTMQKNLWMLALTALLACSACADQQSMKLSDGGMPQQLSSIQAVAASSAAKVGNSNLIMMR